MLIFIVISALIVVGIVDLKLRKKFNIEKNEKFMDQYVGVWHLILEIFLCFSFLAFTTMYRFDQATLYALLLAFIMIIFMFRGFFEFLFKREMRRHYLSFTYVGFCALCSVAIALFM